MKAKSAQAKGKRFEKMVAELVVSMGFGKAQRQAGSGNGMNKGDISWSIPRVPELKNQPSKFPVCLLEWIEQAEKQDLAKEGWVLILRDPRVPEVKLKGFAVIDMHDYLEFEMAKKAPKSKEPDKDLKYRLERLRKLAHDCMKIAEVREDEWKFRDLKMTAGDVIKLLDY